MSKKITKPITKFGGQLIGLEESQWPISEGWDDKMMFVGQILIEKGMLGNDKDFIAYIFVTHPKSCDFEPLKREDIEAAVAIARNAPSACNRQPCRFFIQPMIKRTVLYQH